MLWRHRDDVDLQNLFQHLWLFRERVGARLTFRGLLRSLFTREEIDGGDRWANEIPGLYCAHLTSHAVWPSDDEVCKLLEQNVSLFREEFAGIDPSHYQVDTRDKQVGLTDGRNWTVFPIYDGFGKLQAENAKRCPKIVELLRGIDGVGRMGCMAYFSIMNPKTHVARHTGPTNIRMRYHLGIEVPDRDIFLRIHTQLVAWKQDRCIKFDDSYEHEVFQQSDQRRVVFILDLPHPELRPQELKLLDEIISIALGPLALQDQFEKALDR
jgi:aspartyl/asparaginyl beta-hydroxylase